MEIDFDSDINLTELNKYISQEPESILTSLEYMDIDITEESSITTENNSQGEEDVIFMLYEMIKLTRENRLLEKRVATLQKLVGTKTNSLMQYTRNEFINNIIIKDRSLINQLEIDQDNNYSNIFFLDGRKKKDKQRVNKKKK
jgi:hypothetical protein